jgi:hypothetical protein
VGQFRQPGCLTDARQLCASAPVKPPYPLDDLGWMKPAQTTVLSQTWHKLTGTLAELLTVHGALHAERPRYQALVEFAPDAYLVTNTAPLVTLL